MPCDELNLADMPAFDPSTFAPAGIGDGTVYTLVRISHADGPFRTDLISVEAVL